MKKTGIIGDKDSILCFMAAGFDTFITEDEKEAERVIRSAVANDYAILFVTEELIEKMPGVTAKYKDDPELAIIPLPGRGGSRGIGTAQIKSAVEKAVGADIL